MTTVQSLLRYIEYNIIQVATSYKRIFKKIIEVTPLNLELFCSEMKTNGACFLMHKIVATIDWLKHKLKLIN